MEYEDLTHELIETLLEIDRTLREMKQQFENETSNFPPGTTRSFYLMKDNTGKPLTTDLLTAKANILVMLIKLKGVEG